MSQQLFAALEHLEPRSEESQYVLSAIERINKKAPETLASCDSLADLSGGELQTRANEIRVATEALIREFKEINPEQVFQGIGQLRTAVVTARGLLRIDDDPWASEYTDRLTNFSKAYREFLKNYRHSQTIKLMRAAESIEAWLSSASLLTQAMKASLHSESLSPADDERRLLMLFDATPTLRDLTEKVSAIQSIYSELCELLVITERGHPLRIAKLETGSLLLDLLGMKRVIDLMSNMFESSVQYFHRNFTTEGKLTELPKRLEIVDRLLSTAKIVDDAGAESDVIHENAKKAVVKISQDLVRLLGNDETVSVNGRVYVGSALPHPRVLPSPMKRLESNSESAPPT